VFITFHSKAAGDFMMSGEVAITLLKKMGHSGTVPSAIMPEDIPQALEKLKAAMSVEPVEQPATEGEEPTVSLSRRAYPLVKMLEASITENCEVMWD
jgi:hypothetical protein